MGAFLPGFEAWSDTKIAALVLIIALFVLLRVAFGKGGPFAARNYRPYRGKFSRSVTDFERSHNHFGPQLEAAMASPFEKRRIMNGSEYRVFTLIERDIAETKKGFRVFAQTCLGEILQSSSEDGFRAINSKRVDILIVDQGGWPVLPVEYQGEGHFQGTAAARDAIKKEALRKAGVRYMEIVPADSDMQIVARLRENLGAQRAQAPLRSNFGVRATTY